MVTTADINAIAETALPAAEKTTCFHCGLDIPPYTRLSAKVEDQARPVCCHGCKAAAEFINDSGMAAFYQYRGEQMPQSPRNEQMHHWAEYDAADMLQRYSEPQQDGRLTASIYVQGMYCRSCSWLIQRTLTKLSDGLSLQLNTDAHRLTIQWQQSDIPFSRLLATIEQLGYQPRPLTLAESATDQYDARQSEHRNSLKRLAVAGFGMMQVMTYAIGIYWGDFQGIAPEIRHFLNLISLLVATWVVCYAGQPFFLHAWQDLRNRQAGMDTPVALAIGGAYGFSVWDVFMGSGHHVYFDSAVMFVFFLSLGRFLEMRARYRALASENAMRYLLPSTITVERLEDDQWQAITIDPRQTRRGDELHLTQGETVPFDGVVKQGKGTIDQSFLTGEAKPLPCEDGTPVAAGSILRSGNLTIAASRDWRHSSMAAVQRLLDKSQSRTANNNHSFTDWLSRYFVSGLLILATITAVFWWVYDPSKLLPATLAVLVACCPCAFSLASPAVMTVASQLLGRNGVLLTDPAALERLPAITRWCLDKTGTLTAGHMQLEQVETLSEFSADECLQIISAIEQHSDHVLAQILSQTPTQLTAHSVVEFPGEGLTAIVNNEHYFIGKYQWVCQQLTSPDNAPAANHTHPLGEDNHHSSALRESSACSLVAFASEHRLLALLYLSDSIRQDTKPVLSWLQATGLDLEIVSGDRQSAVDHMARQLPVLKATGNLMPADKLTTINQLQQRGHVVGMIGDGINDAPILSQADVSIALANGSELSQSHAQIILMGGRLSGLHTVYQVAKRAMQIVRQNAFWAIGYNLTVLPLAMAGLLTPWVAAIGMSLSSLLVVANARRLNRMRITDLDGSVEKNSL